MNGEYQEEMIVDNFYDLIKKAQTPVKHAAHQVTNQTNPRSWECELAGTYIMANSQKTVALASDGLRLARFTMGPATIEHQVISFLPHCQLLSYENEILVSIFSQILATWSCVKNCAIYKREELIDLCRSKENNPITMEILGQKVRITHIEDFCLATPEDLITCLIVVNQSPAPQTRLKLVAGPLEELLIPII